MWRNSAGIILFAGPIQYLGSRYTKQSNGQYLPPICMKELVQDLGQSYQETEALFVKRSSKSKFMANVHAFPGGQLDEADYCRDWLNIFHSCDTSSIFTSLSLQPKIPLYSNPLYKDIPGEIAYRICAIRELFEETGVLLVRQHEDMLQQIGLCPGSMSPSLMSLSHENLFQWRDRVNTNAYNFITMCSELRCVPDIFSLIEWSNWLTPKNSRLRFDTVFYLCCLEKKPDVSPDLGEISKLQWINPQKMIELQREKKLLLAPPQFGDVALMARLLPLPMIHSYALYQSYIGSLSRKVSLRILCNDGITMAIGKDDDLYPPGDHMFPSTDDIPVTVTLSGEDVILNVSKSPFWEYECLSHNAKELEELSTHLSRVVIKDNEIFCGMTEYDTVIAKSVARFLKLYSERKIISNL